MSTDYVSELREDLRTKFDRLCWLYNVPALHVDEHFAELRRQVDLDAERLINKIQTFKHKRGKGKALQTANVNQARIKFIRVLDELEKRTGLQPKPQTPASEIYASFEQRIDAFDDSKRSLDDLEDSYVQLAREITAEIERVEKRIFNEQTIIFWPSKDQNRLGSLVYFGDVFLSQRNIDRLISPKCSKEDPSRLQSDNDSLLVPAKELNELSKSKQVVESLSRGGLSRFSNEASKFFYIGKTANEFKRFSGQISSLQSKFFSYELKESKFTLSISGDQDLDTSANLFDVYSSTTCKLEIERRRLESLHTNLLPSHADRLTELILRGVHFESFDTTLLSKFTNLKQLQLKITVSKDVKFDLDFLRSLRELTSLELTLPHSPSDLSMIAELTELKDLKLEGSSFFYAEKLPKLSKIALEQLFSAPKLQSCALSGFDIDQIDRETLNDCRQLGYLDLSRNQFNRNIVVNLGFPVCFDKSTLHVNSCSFIRICLSHSNIGALNAASFAGLTYLQNLSLRGNSIAELPPGLFHDLPSLVFLELDKNRIRHVSSGVFGKLDKLETLTLDDNPIETIKANAFAQLNHLTRLSMNGCRLKSIDCEMFIGMKRLQTLELNNNLIDRIEVITGDGRRINVAKANLNDEEKRLIEKHLFRGLSRLSTLDLEGNKLEKLDLNCFSNLKSAVYFYLSSNKINELSGVAGEELLCQMSELDLNNNQLTTIDQSALPKSLQVINLAKNYLKRLDDDFFTQFTKLKEVNLSENELTWTINEATFASCMYRLGRIDISLNESIRVTEGAFRQMQYLLRIECDFNESLARLPVFETLRIRKLTPEIVRAFKKLPENWPLDRLQAFHFSGCSIEALTRNPDWQSNEKETLEMDHFNLSWLPKALRLSELDFSKNLIERLDDPDLFADLTGMTRIILSDNRLIHVHRDVFKCLPRLERIDLSGNRLSSIDTGLFRHLKCLRDLNISSNNISFFNLARLFRVCPDLTSFNIADNQLDDRSTAEPIDSRLSCHLESLVLANNRFEKMDFVRNMTRLKHLDFRGNRIESVMSNGENMLGRLKLLTHLDLSGNQIRSLTDEMFAHLRGQLERLDLSGNLVDFELNSAINEQI